MSGVHLVPMTFMRHIEASGKVSDFWLCGCCGGWRDAEAHEEEAPPPFCSTCRKHGHGTEKKRAVVNG